MDLLKTTRGYYIAWGQRIAVEVAKQVGEVDSHTLVEEMVKRGILPDPDPVPRYWVGAVFNKNKNFIWSGRHESYSNSKRNNHERTVRVWFLRDDSCNTPPAPHLGSHGLIRNDDGQYALIPDVDDAASY